MKTDRFNEAIRRKLEGIEPPFEEQEWKKFQAFSKQQMPPTWWAKSGVKWIGYGASGLVATVLIVMNIIQYRQNKELTQTVSELRQELKTYQSVPKTESAQTPLTPSYDSTVPSEQLSSVSTAPRTSQNSSDTNKESAEKAASLSRSEASVSSPRSPRITAIPQPKFTDTDGMNHTEGADTKLTDTELTDTKEVDTESGHTAGKRTSRSSVEKRMIESTKETVSTEETRIAEQSNYINRNKKDTYASTVTIRNKRGQRADYEVPAYTETPQPNRTQRSESEVSRPSESYAALAIPTLQPKLGFEVFPSGIPQRMNTPVKRKYTWSSSVAEVPKATSAKIRLPQENTTNIRLGGGLDLEKGYTGKAVTAAVVIGKHWGVSAGLSWGTVQGQQYFDERNFIDRNKQDFRKWHAPRIPPTFKIKDIHTESSVIRMPVLVHYRLPIAPSWTLQASAGTTLDLSVQQKFEFKVVKTNEMFSVDQSRFTPKDPVLNNVTAGIGIEKRWNHIVLQGEGYVAPSLGKCTYRPEQTAVGLRIRALYQFGK